MLKKDLSGFTLVELIIYIALFSLTATALISMGLLVSGVSAKSMSAQAVLLDARQTDSFIKSKLILAESVSSPLSGQSSANLILNYYDGSAGQIYLENNQVNYSEDGLIYNISSSETYVSTLEFVNLGINKDSIKYSFNIDWLLNVDNNHSFASSFTSTVSLR
jgi:type II secretory pathway pseudopilin PulG